MSAYSEIIWFLNIDPKKMPSLRDRRFRFTVIDTEDTQLKRLRSCYLKHIKQFPDFFAKDTLDKYRHAERFLAGGT